MFASGLLTAAIAFPALADPCEAPLPRSGEVFEGRVRYVGDGDMICVEVGGQSSGSTWVEVRLADFNAPELNEPDGRQARDTLRGIAMGQTVRCRAGRRSYDRVVGSCTLDGRPLGDRLRAAGIREGGN